VPAPHKATPVVAVRPPKTSSTNGNGGTISAAAVEALNGLTGTSTNGNGNGKADAHNGSANGNAPGATIGGRPLDGAKGSMLEGGSRVPLIASWPGTVAPGQVVNDLVDSSDFFPTFAELAGTALPSDTIIDGRSFAPRLRGEEGKSRTWIFNQLARNWYVRDAGWKLNQAGDLFDMSDAPFSEKLVAADSSDPAALAARQRLRLVLDQLNPAGGIPDTGDPSGRHASNVGKKKKQKSDAAGSSSVEN
jgi:arylsulfatase A